MTDIVPACWVMDWPLPETVPDPIAEQYPHLAPLLAAATTPEQEIRDRLRAWQYDRCAVCGRKARLVEDHDHESGLTRGFLCGSCNVGEGTNRHRVFSLYRWRHPTSILGLTIPYLEFFTGLPAEPQPHRRTVDKWTDNAVKGIGL